jgi:hypothetical protein
MPSVVASLLLPPAAGTARCFACGWLVGASTQAARRVGLSTSLNLTAIAPLTLGAALASLCAAWHGMMLSCRALGWPRESPSRSIVAGGVAGALACICWPRAAGFGSDVHATIVLSAANVCSRRHTAHSSSPLHHGIAGGTAIGLACTSCWWSLRRYARAAVAAVQLSLARDVEDSSPPVPASSATQACAQVASTSPVSDASRACLSSPLPASVTGATAAGGHAATLSRAELESRAYDRLRRLHRPPLSIAWLPFIAVQAAVRACDASRGAPTLTSFSLAAAAGWADGTRAELCRAVPVSVLLVRAHPMLGYRLSHALARHCPPAPHLLL